MAITRETMELLRNQKPYVPQSKEKTKRILEKIDKLDIQKGFMVPEKYQILDDLKQKLMNNTTTIYTYDRDDKVGIIKYNIDQDLFYNIISNFICSIEQVDPLTLFGCTITKIKQSIINWVPYSQIIDFESSYPGYHKISEQTYDVYDRILTIINFRIDDILGVYEYEEVCDKSLNILSYRWNGRVQDK